MVLIYWLPTTDRSLLTLLTCSTSPTEPGSLSFEKRGYLVKESCGNAEISVLRQNGADGEISVKWKTTDKTAINGKDYRGGEGLVQFKHGEVSLQGLLSSD